MLLINWWDIPAILVEQEKFQFTERENDAAWHQEEEGRWWIFSQVIDFLKPLDSRIYKFQFFELY